MRAHRASSMTQLSNAAPKPWTCVFTGSRTGRVVQGQQYVVHWRKGSDNLADYFTKHHSRSHHCLMQSPYLVNLHRPAPLQGCDEPAAQPLAGYTQIPTTDKPYCLALLSTNNLARLRPSANASHSNVLCVLRRLPLLTQKLSSSSLGLILFHQYRYLLSGMVPR